MIMHPSRRQFLAGMLAAPIAASMPSLAAADPQAIYVAKTATCGCCKLWIEHLEKEGFKVEAENMAMGQLSQFKTRHGISPDLASCHTGRVAGYTIEGHVPAREINRLLAEKPDAIGLTVPGMPMGSPGMDYGPEKEPYDVLLIAKDGTTSVYASYKGPAG
jgi:hypothetical protein